jgi:hypothetical protein
VSPRPVYLTKNKVLTALDLNTVEDCDRWIRALDTELARMPQNPTTPREKSALYYRRRALLQVKTRRADLS